MNNAFSFTLRPATREDAPAVVELIRAECIADGDPDDATNLQELLDDWQNLNLLTDTFVAVTPQGQVIGYEEFSARPGHANLLGDGYVHPDFKNLGIGTALLQALENRARQEIPLAEADRRVFLRNFMTAGDQAGRALHQNLGWRAIRYSWSMRIDLESAPPSPVFPAGIEIRPFDEAQHLQAVYETIEAAFADHWGHIRPSFSDWKKKYLSPERYEPDLWFAAWEGQQLAGVCICRWRNGLAWVWNLGVRRAWRKRGLGMALLLHAFGEFYRRGHTRIGLGVDASNPTGATRLYERAGMRIETEYVCYEKELRPGSEPEEGEP